MLGQLLGGFGSGPRRCFVAARTREFRDSSGAVVTNPYPIQVTERGRTDPTPPELPATLSATSDRHFGTHAARRAFTTAFWRRRWTMSAASAARSSSRSRCTDVDQTLHHLFLVEILVAGGVLLALALLAWWVVRLELRPLEQMGETAGAIAAGDLSRRVEPADDRTEVGRLGLALNSMLGQIEVAFAERTASEARLRRFVADASHELRTPLTSIRGYAELFRRGASTRPDDLAKTMLRIEEAAARMGVLVEDLLLLARLDQGRPLEREQVDLTALVGAAVDDLRATSPDRPSSTSRTARSS